MAPFHFAAALLAQQDDAQRQIDAAGGAMSMLCNCVILIVAIISVIGMWKVFEKAGKPGWAAIIPIYNLVVLLEIIGRPIWWIILLLIPCVGAVVSIILSIDVAKSFGKGTGFGLGLAFLPMIFYILLGFGDARYLGPSVPPPGTPAA